MQKPAESIDRGRAGQNCVIAAQKTATHLPVRCFFACHWTAPYPPLFLGGGGGTHSCKWEAVCANDYGFREEDTQIA